MTPGEITLLKIVSHTPDLQPAREQFHIAFPTRLSDLAFSCAADSLMKQGLLRRAPDWSRLQPTAAGRDMLNAELRAEEVEIY